MREWLNNKQRIVVKVGSSTLTHEKTGCLNLGKMEHLVRILTDLRNQGKDVILVSSGAIAVGTEVVKLKKRPEETKEKQACAAIGQARLMMVYQKLFAEYNQLTAQILMTKYTMRDAISQKNAKNTFQELFTMGVIPIVNENDTISTDELEFGDNDTLSAMVTALVQGDLLILLSDIDGFYTDDPHKNPAAAFIHQVNTLNSELYSMAKGTNTLVGTGGMATKITAARIATDSGADMIIANGREMTIIRDIMKGKEVGTIFLANPCSTFCLLDYLNPNSLIELSESSDRSR